jgi:hypothetical protein
MDIIDVMLARALTPQGQTETYVSIANAAAAKAAKAEQDAESAIATVEAAADEIATAKEEAADLLADAHEALETAQAAQINLPEAYSTTGQNTDGYMTQKATTDALAEKMNTFNLNDYASKQYVTQQINNVTINGNSASIQFSTDDAGHLVTIDENGNLMPSTITDESLIDALIGYDSYSA